MQIDSTGFVQALVYSSLLYNENNRLILQFCPVCTASSPQSGFSSKRNECCNQCSRTYACGYQVPTSVETGCFLYLFVKDEVNLSAMGIDLTLDIVTVRKCSYKIILEGTRTDHSQCKLNVFHFF